jgi:hypothetical protein
MSRHLVPVYVARAAWRVWEAFERLEIAVAFGDAELELDALRGAVRDLEAALLRGHAVEQAPTTVLMRWLDDAEQAGER